MLDLIWLSIIQGVTEFLPISSSAHLVLYSHFFNFNYDNLSLDISLHLGSLIAIIFYFRKEIVNFASNIKLLFFITLGSLPTLLAGFILVKFNLIDNLRNIEIIGWTTLVFGVILYLSDLRAENKNIDNDLSLRSALFIGFFQILSLVPGVSRSGIIISASRILSFKRTEAARLSFLLSIPTLSAVSMYNVNELILTNNLSITIDNYSSMSLSMFFSFFSIKYLIKYLRRFSLFFFVIYRVILGIIIIAYVY
jgi:undecaprenyl-diphosphatase